MNNLIVTADTDGTSLNDTIIALGAIFMTVVVPCWLIFRRPAPAAQPAPVPVASGELWERARRMETRIETLERVLDTELPGWRARV